MRHGAHDTPVVFFYVVSELIPGLHPCALGSSVDSLMLRPAAMLQLCQALDELGIIAEGIDDKALDGMPVEALHRPGYGGANNGGPIHALLEIRQGTPVDLCERRFGGVAGVQRRLLISQVQQRRQALNALKPKDLSVAGRAMWDLSGLRSQSRQPEGQLQRSEPGLRDIADASDPEDLFSHCQQLARSQDDGLGIPVLGVPQQHIARGQHLGKLLGQPGQLVAKLSGLDVPAGDAPRIVPPGPREQRRRWGGDLRILGAHPRQIIEQCPPQRILPTTGDSSSEHPRPGNDNHLLLPRRTGIVDDHRDTTTRQRPHHLRANGQGDVLVIQRDQHRRPGRDTMARRWGLPFVSQLHDAASDEPRGERHLRPAQGNPVPRDLTRGLRPALADADTVHAEWVTGITPACNGGHDEFPRRGAVADHNGRGRHPPAQHRRILSHHLLRHEVTGHEDLHPRVGCVEPGQRMVSEQGRHADVARQAGQCLAEEPGHSGIVAASHDDVAAASLTQFAGGLLNPLATVPQSIEQRRSIPHQDSYHDPPLPLESADYSVAGRDSQNIGPLNYADPVSKDAVERRMDRKIIWELFFRHPIRRGWGWVRTKWREGHRPWWLIRLIFLLTTGVLFIWLLIAPDDRLAWCVPLLTAAAASSTKTWLQDRVRNPPVWVLIGVTLLSFTLSTRHLWGCSNPAGRVPILTELLGGLSYFLGGEPNFSGCSPSVAGLVAAQLLAVGVALGTVWTLLSSVTASLRDSWRARWARRVVLVIGLNNDSLRVIKELVDNRHMVVVLEPDPDHKLTKEARSSGARIVTGDLTVKKDRGLVQHMIRPAWLGNRWALERCYLLDESDYTNVQAANIIIKILNELREKTRSTYPVPPRIIVRIDDVIHARDYIRRQALDDSPAFISTIGIPQMTARAIVECIRKKTVARLHVVGDGDLADAICDEWETVKKLVPVLQESPIETEICNKEPDYENLGNDIVVVYAEPSPEKLRNIEEQAEGPSEDAEVLSEDRGIRIFSWSPEVIGVAEEPILGNIHLFGPTLGSLPGETGCLAGVPEDAWLRAAQTLHESYRKKYDGKRWEELNQYEIEKNLRSIWTTVRAPVEKLNRTWTRGFPAPPTTEEINQLIENEHNAWYEFDHANGFFSGNLEPGIDDKTSRQAALAKQHFGENWLMHPYETLTTEAPALEDNTTLAGRRLKTCTTNTHDSIHHNLGILNALGYELHSREVIQG